MINEAQEIEELRRLERTILVDRWLRQEFTDILDELLEVIECSMLGFRCGFMIVDDVYALHHQLRLRWAPNAGYDGL